MSASLNGLLQVLLVIAWYAVPAMATIPWYLIFLPTLIPVIILGVVLFFLAVATGAAALTQR